MRHIGAADQLFGLACPNCRADVTVRGQTQVFRGRCPKCARAVTVDIDVGNHTRGFLVPTASVAIQLSRPSPSASELVALRRLVAEWKDESLEALKARVANRGEWVLDGVPERELENLMTEAGASGVALVIKRERLPLWRRIVGRRIRVVPHRVRVFDPG
jgi:hypothetical protein